MTQWMGIVNVTPDSFSDGGRFLEPSQAWQQMQYLAQQGAHILDLGAQSTRPDFEEISEEEEWSRLEPILKRWHTDPIKHVILSIDTYRPRIMESAVHLGAQMINNVKGLTSKTLLKFLAKKQVAYVAMHGREEKSSVEKFFLETEQSLKSLGFAKYYLDPGVGFGKTDRELWQIFQSLPAWAASYPLLVGVSRKSWMKRFLNLDLGEPRNYATRMADLWLAALNVAVVRTHDLSFLSPWKGRLS